MTVVGESLTTPQPLGGSGAGPAVGSATASQQQQTPSSGGLASEHLQQQQQQQQVGGRNPLALKVNQEVLTSLHLIKDIRRLEKYQRDFFLKVRLNLLVEK